MTTERDNSSIIYRLFLVFSGILIAAAVSFALISDGIANMFAGLINIFVTSAFLAVDTYMIGGVSAAFLNAGLIGFALCFFFRVLKIKASGYTMVSFFLAVSLAFASLSLVGVAFIVPGVLLFAYARREPLSHYANNAVLAVALEPTVSLVLFSSLPVYVAIPLSLLTGLALGFVFQPVFTRTQVMHRGHNLYNTGLAAGFIAAIVCALLRSTSTILPDSNALHDMLKLSVPSGDVSAMFFVVFGGSLAACLICGLKLSGWSFKGYAKLLAHSGHGFDFTVCDGMGSVLINMALMGAITLVYFIIAGIPLTGLAACALLGVVGLSGEGAHPRNSVPVVVGYAAIALLIGSSLSSSIFILGLPFAVALAPISGRFGSIFGFLAGTMQALLMPYAITLSGGLNLCAGGLCSGIVAVVLTSVLESVRPRIFDRDKAEKQETRFMSADGGKSPPRSAQTEPALKDSYDNSHTDAALLIIRNILAVIAGALFIASVVLSGGITFTLRAAAYIIGALAYGAEILVLTDMFRTKQSLHEMLMPYLFGLLYIVLGLSYLIPH